MSDDEVYVRRVREPNPLFETLAAQVVDRLTAWQQDGLVVQPSTWAAAAREAGVPLAYLLDERERRVREAGR